MDIILKWLPAANLVALVFGGLWGFAMLKESLQQLIHDVGRIMTQVEDHEKRITKIENMDAAAISMKLLDHETRLVKIETVCNMRNPERLGHSDAVAFRPGKG